VGKNRKLGAEAAAASGVNPLPALPPSLFPLGGTTVHIGPVGQYTMAATILKALKVDGEASSATLSADGQVVEAWRCAITGLVASDGNLAFTRLDEAGPWPILPAAKSALQLVPEELDLSRYMLQVTGLAEGNYRVTINGKSAAKLSAQQLADGWNMTSVFSGALAERSTAILDQIGLLQGRLNSEWRDASAAHNTAKLAVAQANLDACAARLQALVQPVPLHFTIERTFSTTVILPGTRPDAATATRGVTVLHPLANDVFPGDATITEVSDPAILINGRALIVPEGFTGTFT
jgi:hypothetical protein